MPKEPPPLSPIAVLLRRASLNIASMPGQLYQSLLIPAPGPSGLNVACLYASVEEHENERKLRAPSYISLLQAETGLLEELRALTPKELGVQQEEGAWIGLDPAIDDEADPERLARRGELYANLEPLLGLYAAGETSLAAGPSAAARELKALYPRVMEPPLVPYYNAVGRHFFAWLDRAAA